jgi:hypothetical protein
MIRPNGQSAVNPEDVSLCKACVSNVKHTDIHTQDMFGLNRESSNETIKMVWSHIKGRSEVKIARNSGCCLNNCMFIFNINIAYN